MMFKKKKSRKQKTPTALFRYALRGSYVQGAIPDPWRVPILSSRNLHHPFKKEKKITRVHKGDIRVGFIKNIFLGKQ